MAEEAKSMSDIGLFGLATMGQNLALNIASKGFTISVCNRSPEKVISLCADRHVLFTLRCQVDATVERAKEEGDLPLTGYKDVGTPSSLSCPIPPSIAAGQRVH